MKGDKEDGHGTDATMTREQLLTDPEQAADFVKRTQLDALAIAIGTSHGAYKFTRKPTGDILAIDRIKEIHRRIPNTHLVMHGSPRVPQDLLADHPPIRRRHEGNLRRAGRGNPGSHQARRAQDQHRHRHPPGHDRRGAQVPGREPRQVRRRANGSSRRAKPPRQICKQRYIEFGCEGQAGKIKGDTLQVVADKYAKGELAQVVH